MISFLEGTVAEKGADRVILNVGGVGYEVAVPTPTLARLPGPGRKAQVFTRLQVRDDAMVLFGFASTDEREVFDALVTVTGVGPKMALAVLSTLSPDALRRAVTAGDGAALTLVPGVGKKVAGRMLLELKDRLGVQGEVAAATGSIAEVREALLALGLSVQEARDALVVLGTDGERPVEQMLRDALRSVGR
jgi:holliday junction DNA helicase RuvA